MGKQTGTVAKWLNHKGIGFITPEGETEGENDILVHFGEVKQTTEDGFISLEAGSAVEFEVEVDPKNEDKKIAVKVTGKDGADCTPRTKGKGKGKKGRGKGKKGKGKGKKGEKKDEEEEKEE